MENRDVLMRPAPVPNLTVGYGSDPDQVADIRLTAEGRPSPLVLLWHGGFWRPEWDRTHVGPMAAELARQGFVVASLEYRRTGWPDTFADAGAAADAVPALVEHALPGRIDQQRIVYAGHSAGGQLALWAALRDRRQDGTGNAPGAAGVLALAPVSDLAAAYRLDLDGGAVEALLGGGPDEVPDRYAAADPAMLGKPSPAVVLVHGEEDGRVPVAMSRRYAAAVGARLVELPGADHFSLIDPESAAWPLVLDALRSLV